MTASLVLTVIGVDKPGLVESLSQIVRAHGGNWEASRMAHLAGRFTGLLLVTVDEERAAALQDALIAIPGLKVVVERAVDSPADRSPDLSMRQLRLEVVGTDRPGIIHDISQVLTERGVNVDELSTECTSAPMTGGNIFEMLAQLSCPVDVDVDELHQLIEELASDLMVNLEAADEDA